MQHQIDWLTEIRIKSIHIFIPGYRMPAPECATPEIYRLMLRCWGYEPETRPHFDEIYTIVDALASY